MRIHGYCTGCRRVKLVSISGHQLALGAARGDICEGICSDCEEAERKKRSARP